MNLEPDTVLYGPPQLFAQRREGTVALIDRDGPNWLATDERGEVILRKFDGRRAFDQVVREYAAEQGIDGAKAWQHVDTVTRDALRQSFLDSRPLPDRDYAGRSGYLTDAPLSELWVHTNNSCNLSCSHCLVSSGPSGDRGLPTADLLGVLAQARALGTKRFYFTGGEPLLRKDILQLCEFALADEEAELAILTNGILLRGSRLAALRRLDLSRLRLQISLDGSTPALNDPIRGLGTFGGIVAGIRNAIQAGFNVAVTTAITSANADDVPAVTRLIAELGGAHHHLLWLHKRGRAADGGTDHTPPIEKVIEVVRKARAVGRSVGVMIDNHESLKMRLNMPAGVKRDLSNACVSSLCVYSDGNVYPSAATANIPELCCGNIHRQSLQAIWRDSDISRQFREATVHEKEICRTCPLKFLCGGGDIEHAYFYGGSITAHDPYCELHKSMIADAIFERADERKAVLTNGKSGFNAPVAFTGMGEGAIHCATDEPVPELVSSHSECVLSFELDAPREKVREFYGEAAETPQAELCCPTRPDPEAIAHIPREVLERFYGCGSPVDLANIGSGEVTVDLGSGAGIDVFIAAKKVGRTGRAIGVDMTAEMLRVAKEAKRQVATTLGYDVVDFRHGFLEDIPVDDNSVDVVTSNCVINLSPDKKQVFKEMWRVLKNHGRIVVSDIVSHETVPAHQRRDPRLWGECISGALTEEEMLAYLERAGFYGVHVLRKTFWKEVEGYRFHSVTVRGYKFAKQAGCVYRGQTAVYRGPFKGVTDEEGHFFPRGVPVEICTDTATKLGRAPYVGMFILPDVGVAEDETDNACCETTGCC